MPTEQWEPIPLTELYDLIHAAEAAMYGGIAALWQLLRIDPEKWQEPGYGAEGGGFWAVGLIGRQVIWYNDIEAGFNISKYSAYGIIGTYYCNQDDLHACIRRLDSLIRFGGTLTGQCGSPE